MERARVIGIDYGTDSVRLILVDPVDGVHVARVWAVGGVARKSLYVMGVVACAMGATLPLGL